MRAGSLHRASYHAGIFSRHVHLVTINHDVRDNELVVARANRKFRAIERVRRFLNRNRTACATAIAMEPHEEGVFDGVLAR